MVDFKADDDVVILSGGEEVGAGGVDSEAPDGIGVGRGEGWFGECFVIVDFISGD